MDDLRMYYNQMHFYLHCSISQACLTTEQALFLNVQVCPLFSLGIFYSQKKQKIPHL